MRKHIKNEAGLTLVEMLATISIASMIILMITSTHLFIQKQYNKQSEQISQLNDMTYVMKLITHDFRRAESRSDDPNKEESVVIKSEHSIDIGKHNYTWDESQELINRNQNPIMNNISDFSVIEENHKIIHISFKHVDGKAENLTLTRREEE